VSTRITRNWDGREDASRREAAKRAQEEISDEEDGGEYAEEDGVRFSVIEDPEEIERLEKGKKVSRFRAMVEIDGKLYPPMSVYVDGKLREPTETGVWERSDETPIVITEKQKASMAALDARKGDGTVTLIKGKLRYRKDSEAGKRNFSSS